MTATSAVATVNPWAHAHPMAASNSIGNSSAAPSTISSNDFLTLLVTEMKNQDPTAQTDPNEYINQLVQVNSLEQLIQINQSLSGALGSGSSEGMAASGDARPASVLPASPGSAATTGEGTGISTGKVAIPSNPIPALSGNLGAPAVMPAALRVSQALSGRN